MFLDHIDRLELEMESTRGLRLGSTYSRNGDTSEAVYASQAWFQDFERGENPQSFVAEKIIEQVEKQVVRRSISREEFLLECRVREVQTKKRMGAASKKLFESFNK